MLTLLLVGGLTSAIKVKPAKTSGTIHIRADGNVDPSSAPIHRDGCVYTFTDDIYDSIKIERDNTIVDGNGYTLQGMETGTGIALSNRSNVTIKNMKIKAFFQGIFLFSSSHNTIFGNDITANDNQGIWLRYSSNNNSITGNEIVGNSNGITLCWNSSYNNISGNNISDNVVGIRQYKSSYNIIYNNSFIGNKQQVHSDEAVNIWDDGYPSGGNYWSNYTDVDAYSGPNQNETNSDGIGDTVYVIDENNQDNYPLMDPWGAYTQEIPAPPFWMQWWFWAIVVAGIFLSAGTVHFLKKRKSTTNPPFPSESMHRELTGG